MVKLHVDGQLRICAWRGFHQVEGEQAMRLKLRHAAIVCRRDSVRNGCSDGVHRSAALSQL